MYRTSILTILFFLIATFTHCWSSNSNYGDKVRISGKLVYSTDGTPLKQGVIYRVSDNICFLTDDDGSFHIEAPEGDSLRFSYIGKIEKVLPVNANNTSIVVELDPYIPGNDEYVVKVESNYPEMEVDLKTYVSDKNARIGIAVIIAGKDTVSVNGNQYFPMMSVFKFPQALAVADYCMKNDISLSDSIAIKAAEIKENTWSPMRDKYGIRHLKLPLSKLLDYILQKSDNNASDILFRVIGGTSVADSLMKSLGYNDIMITHTEDEMHRDTDLCYLNQATPIEMAKLFDSFYRQGMRHESQFHELIAQSMLSCQTGLDRLSVPLMPTNAIIGHKTGTGDRNSHGRIMAVNDAGYIFIPNKTGYAIAVFVADSAYDMAETSRMIAKISEIVYNSLTQQNSIIGEYESDGSTLRITKESNKKYKVTINLFRLTKIETEANEKTDKCLNFTGIDASGEPISGEITVNGDTATLKFTDSTWGYLPNGTNFYFAKR